jgi:hypothetical protein
MLALVCTLLLSRETPAAIVYVNNKKYKTKKYSRPGSQIPEAESREKRDTGTTFFSSMLAKSLLSDHLFSSWFIVSLSCSIILLKDQSPFTLDNHCHPGRARVRTPFSLSEPRVAIVISAEHQLPFVRGCLVLANNVTC